ncbi:hypothetical protein D3C87_1089810 [compost metagenome]
MRMPLRIPGSTASFSFQSKGICMESGERGSKPLCVVKSRPTSRTLRPMGPSFESRSIHTSDIPAWGTLPCDGRIPKTWFQPAGFRSEPIPSDPSATGSMRCAREAAAPPLLPPALTAGSHALRVTPHRVLNVCEPSPNSGVVVLPITMQPAAFMRAVRMESLVGMLRASSSQPFVVGKPTTSAKSLTAMGMPCSQPRTLPLASSTSAASASANSFSTGAMFTMVLKMGLSAWMRSTVACISSRQENDRRRRPSASSEAVRSVKAGLTAAVSLIISPWIAAGRPTESPAPSHLTSSVI